MAENVVGIEEPQASNGVALDFISLFEVFFPPIFKQGTGRKRLAGHASVIANRGWML